MYQDAAEQTGCKVRDVVNVSHLYAYLAVTENHVTDDFALAGATAYCVCGTGWSNSDASSSTLRGLQKYAAQATTPASTATTA
jgi:hypothetical protein